MRGGELASAVVAATGVPITGIEVVYELDMQHLGQTHTVTAPLAMLPSDETPHVSEATIRTAFEQAYRASFSRLLPGLPIRVASLRVAAIGRRPPFDFSVLAPAPSASLEKARHGSRPVWLAGRWHDTTIWSRLDLPVDAQIEGPAVLEQPDATIVLEPGMAGRVDRLGNLIVERIR